MEDVHRFVHIDYINGITDHPLTYWESGALPYYVVGIDPRGVYDVTRRYASLVLLGDVVYVRRSISLRLIQIRDRYVREETIIRKYRDPEMWFEETVRKLLVMVRGHDYCNEDDMEQKQVWSLISVDLYTVITVIT